MDTNDQTRNSTLIFLFFNTVQYTEKIRTTVYY